MQYEIWDIFTFKNNSKTIEIVVVTLCKKAKLSILSGRFTHTHNAKLQNSTTTGDILRLFLQY